MPTLTNEQWKASMAKNMGDLASVVRDMAMHVYSKHDPEMGGENDGMGEDYDTVNFFDESDLMPEDGGMGMDDPMMGGEEEEMDPMAMSSHGMAMGGMEDPMMGDAGMGGDPMMGDPGMEDPMMEDDLQMMGGMHKGGTMDADDLMNQIDKMNAQLRIAKRNLTRIQKGYNDVSMERSDEEDSPFDEQQDSLDGNEPSPAGEQGGDREDETFNMQFQSLQKEISKLKGQLNKKNIAKTQVIIPGQANINKSDSGKSKVIDRDLETEIKKRSYREINALREDLGMLPKHALTNQSEG